MLFSYSTKTDGKIIIVHLSGELIDREQPKALLDEVDKNVGNGMNKFLLDLKNLRYINSSGLNVLINILTKARKSGGDVAICNVNDKNKELLVITKLDSIFNVSKTVEDATSVLNN